MKIAYKPYQEWWRERPCETRQPVRKEKVPNPSANERWGSDILAHIVTLLGQLVKKILDTGYHAVGIGGVQIRGN